MTGLTKAILVFSFAVAPMASYATLKNLDNDSLSSVSGQSGIVIEANFGQTGGDKLTNLEGFKNIIYDPTVDGIHIDAFKWILNINPELNGMQQIDRCINCAGKTTQ